MPLTSQLPAALANSSLVRLMSSAVARPVFCNSSAVFLMSSAAIVDLLCGCVSGPFSDKRCDRLIVPAAMAFLRPLLWDWPVLLCGPFANFFFLGLAIQLAELHGKGDCASTSNAQARDSPLAACAL